MFDDLSSIDVACHIDIAGIVRGNGSRVVPQVGGTIISRIPAFSPFAIIADRVIISA